MNEQAQVTTLTKNQLWAASWIKNLMRMKPVFLDTETTGFGPQTQVIELTIIEHSGEVLFDSLFSQTCEISPEAMAVNHITPEMTAQFPPFVSRWREINEILANRVIFAYNADFDMRMLYQTGVLNNYGPSMNFMGAIDVMAIYAIFHGEINYKTGHAKWQKLANAALQMGISVDDTLHRARDDAELTRQLCIALSNIAPD